MKFFQQIDFLVISYRGERCLSDVFGPMEKILSLAEVIAGQRSTPVAYV